MMQLHRILITVDGLAGSGKTTLARELAARLSFKHLNSGLLYRAVGYMALKSAVSTSDGKSLARLIAEHSIKLVANSTNGDVLVDNQVVTELIREPRVSEAASQVSAHIEVRRALIPHQQSAFEPHPLVAEGRDMGTVVFPEANLKFFVQVDVAIRIERRLAQLGIERNDTDAARQIEQEILERDRRDEERAISPTKPADDAVIIDNSRLPLTEVVENMYNLAVFRGLTSK